MALPAATEPPRVFEVSTTTKVASACRNHSIPEQYWENINIAVNLERNSPIGVFIKKNIVISTRHGSPFQGLLIHGDILISVNNIQLNEDQIFVKNTVSKVVSAGGKITIRAVRLRRHCPIKCSLPVGFTAEDGFDYDWVMLYYIKGMSLGVSMKEIDQKIFVALLKPDGIACMGLSTGERIIDIDGQVVTSIKNTISVMARQMEKNGMIRICVELPTNDMQRNMIRARITTACAPDEPMDNPPAEETQAFAEKGIGVIKNCKEPKPIMKSSEIKQQSASAMRAKQLNFNEKTVESGVFVEVHSRLLVTVPPMKTVDSEAAMAGGGK